MAKQRVVGTGSVEDRIDHLFSYKGMEDVPRSTILALMRLVHAFLPEDRPRQRAIAMAQVLGVPSLSSTRVPLHMSQSRLMVYNNRYGWSLTPEASEYTGSLHVD